MTLASEPSPESLEFDESEELPEPDPEPEPDPDPEPEPEPDEFPFCARFCLKAMSFAAPATHRAKGDLPRSFLLFFFDRPLHALAGFFTRPLLSFVRPATQVFLVFPVPTEAH